MAKDTEDKEKRNKEDTRVISSEGKAAIAGRPTFDTRRGPKSRWYTNFAVKYSNRSVGRY